MSGTVKWYLHWITRKILPENAPVRLTRAQLEELDYRRLYRAYSPKERKSAADPRVMFKVRLIFQQFFLMAVYHEIAKMQLEIVAF